ncbi:MAG: TetR/AcrR family transcriptional regulator [Muribaculaceae bacterium]|nr:TetR/AcrR family transcriptional regulator [Muribaculaceae bacterium]
MTKHQNNKEQAILAAAKEEFLDKGYDGARTTSIARAAGVTHAMLHYYFKTKEQLFEHIFQETMGMLVEGILEVFTQTDKPFKERIAEALGIHFEVIRENPRLPLFMIREVASRPERFAIIKNVISTFAGNLLIALQRDIDQAVAKGEISHIDATTLLLDMISLNVFPFIVKPVFEAATGLDLNVDSKFWELRKQENTQLIMRRLTPMQS